MRKLRGELKKVQDLNQQSQREVQNYESHAQQAADKLRHAEEKQRLSLQEVAMREEQIVVLKVEVASLQEKLRHRMEEVRGALLRPPTPGWMQILSPLKGHAASCFAASSHRVKGSNPGRGLPVVTSDKSVHPCISLSSPRNESVPMRARMGHVQLFWPDMAASG